MSDIIRPIEPFFITQGFGENPARYKKYGLNGHNGIDIRTKYPDTPLGQRNIVASAQSQFYKVRDEGKTGYGKYFEVFVHAKNLWKLTYAHCHSISTFAWKKEGEPMAVSDNTGNSTGAHLHLTVKKGRMEGNVFKPDDYNNGFFGAVDPGLLFNELKELKDQGDEMPTVSVDSKTYEILVGNSTKWDGVVKKLEIQGNPNDTPLSAAEDVIEGIRSRSTDLQKQLTKSEAEVENRVQQVSRINDQLIEEVKLRKDAVENLNKATKNAAEVVGLYEGRILTMQEQINKIAAEKGRCLIDLAAATQKPTPNSPSLFYQLALLLKKLLDFVKEKRR